jgi:integration host factor subunit beta
MNRSDLIKKLAERNSRLACSDTELIVKSILGLLSERLANGGRIEIRGFGVFGLHRRESRFGRNPKTGESIKVPIGYYPHFKPGRELKIRVDKKGFNNV